MARFQGLIKSILVAITIFGAQFYAPSIVAQTTDELFEKVLSNPDDLDTNLEFGKAAEREGNDRHALAAYERAVRANRDSRTAYRNFDRLRLRLSPPITSGRASLGASFSTNIRQAADEFDTPSDGRVEARLSIRDERTLAKIRLRSHGFGSARVHFDESDLNLGTIKAWTGPVIRPLKDIEINVAGGGGARFFDDDLLYLEASGKAELAFIGDGPPQLLVLYGGYREVKEQTDSSRTDGVFINIRGRFSQFNVLSPGDAIYFQPAFSWSDGSDSGFDAATFDSAQTVRDGFDYGGRISYFIPVVDDIATVGAGARLRQTQFEQKTSAGGSRRQDTRLEGTLHLIFNNLIDDNIDLRFDYRYEHNDSNDSTEEFDNHVIGSKVVWRF